jgi:hypothetical protein
VTIPEPPKRLPGSPPPRDGGFVERTRDGEDWQRDTLPTASPRERSGTPLGTVAVPVLALATQAAPVVAVFSAQLRGTLDPLVALSAVRALALTLTPTRERDTLSENDPALSPADRATLSQIAALCGLALQSP